MRSLPCGERHIGVYGGRLKLIESVLVLSGLLYSRQVLSCD